MVHQFRFSFVLLFFFVLHSQYFFCVLSSGSSTVKPKTRLQYFELRRQKQVTTSLPSPSPTSARKQKTTTEAAVDEDEEEIEKPRVFGNARGGEQSSKEPEVSESEDSKEKSTPEVTSKRTKPTLNGRRSYLEYFRPGARNKSSARTTTRAPRKSKPRKESNSDTSAPPSGCSECRFYCKQCRGTEEVSTGGVWGCCKHNCCGGRCSCQKVQI